MGSLPPTLVALVAVALLVLVMRWVFKPARPFGQRRRPVDATEAEDLGLLVVVGTGLSRVDALERRAALGVAGIRSSMSRRHDGTMDVLVFRADADRARTVLGP